MTTGRGRAGPQRLGHGRAGPEPAAPRPPHAETSLGFAGVAMATERGVGGGLGAGPAGQGPVCSLRAAGGAEGLDVPGARVSGPPPTPCTAGRVSEPLGACPDWLWPPPPPQSRSSLALPSADPGAWEQLQTREERPRAPGARPPRHRRPLSKHPAPPPSLCAALCAVSTTATHGPRLAATPAPLPAVSDAATGVSLEMDIT